MTSALWTPKVSLRTPSPPAVRPAEGCAFGSSERGASGRAYLIGPESEGAPDDVDWTKVRR
jgi:hypothetical protein